MIIIPNFLSSPAPSGLFSCEAGKNKILIHTKTNFLRACRLPTIRYKLVHCRPSTSYPFTIVTWLPTNEAHLYTPEGRLTVDIEVRYRMITDRGIIYSMPVTRVPILIRTSKIFKTLFNKCSYLPSSFLYIKRQRKLIDKHFYFILISYYILIILFFFSCSS